MRLTITGRYLALSACLALALAPKAAQAQAKAQGVTFDSADGVELKGSFYPGGQGNKSPCVILMHEFGGSHDKNGWDVLAAALAEKGFAVLAFDFRGHGESTTVNPNLFWQVPANRAGFKFTAKDNNNIDAKDIASKSKFAIYYPMLTNDIAAAKRFLDQRNDAGDCNSSSVLLVGAKESAALGSVFLAKAWQTQRTIPHPINPLILMPDPKGKMEGEDYAGAAWLSIPDKLCNVAVTNWLGRTATQMMKDKTPMVFFSGDKDLAAKEDAGKILAALRSGTGVRKEVNKLTLWREKKNVKSSGADMLAKKGIDVEVDIVDYFEKVMAERGNKAWEDRGAAKAPNSRLMSLKPYFSVP